MSVNLSLFILGTVCLMVYFHPIKKKKYPILLICGLIILFAPSFLARYILGKWNSISEIEEKKVDRVILRPSQPKWEVNLIDTVVEIQEGLKTRHLISLLKNTTVSVPNHANRVWEVEILLIMQVSDTVVIRVERLEGYGAVIYSKRGEFKRDSLAEYLEQITNYSRPLKGK